MFTQNVYTKYLHQKYLHQKWYQNSYFGSVLTYQIKPMYLTSTSTLPAVWK